MKAGKSSAFATFLPSEFAKSWIVSKVGSSVAMPRTSSTSSITGTGFMKCMPMKRSGRSVEAASRVMEMEEVFVAISASSLRCGQSSAKILRFTSSFSVADSITMSASSKPSMLSAAWSLSSAASRCSTVMRSLDT